MEKIEIKDYGDLLSRAKGKKCIVYEVFGSYQGEWVAVLENEDSIELWKGYYGSCSGCDFLLNCDNMMTEQEIKDHFKEEKEFLIIPTNIAKQMTLSEFQSLLPLNIKDIYDFNPEQMFNAIRTYYKTGV